MHKIKLLLLITLTFLLSGCTIWYNLDISENSIDEHVLFAMYDTVPIERDIYKDEITDLTPAISTFNSKNIISKYAYITNITEDSNDRFSFDYKYKFNFNNYNKSGALKKCNIDLDYKYKNNILSISTGEKFQCILDYDIKVLIINIKVDGYVIQANADEYDYTTNTYTWKYTQSSFDNHSIKIAIDFDSTEKNTKTKSNNTFPPLKDEDGNIIEEEPSKIDEDNKQVQENPETNKDKVVKDLKETSNLVLYIIIIVGAITIILAIYLLKKNKKVNEI